MRNRMGRNQGSALGLLLAVAIVVALFSASPVAFAQEQAAYQHTDPDYQYTYPTGWEVAQQVSANVGRFRNPTTGDTIAIGSSSFAEDMSAEEILTSLVPGFLEMILSQQEGSVRMDEGTLVKTGDNEFARYSVAYAGGEAPVEIVRYVTVQAGYLYTITYQTERAEADALKVVEDSLGSFQAGVVEGN